MLSFIKNDGWLGQGLCKDTWRKNKVVIMAAMTGRGKIIYIVTLEGLL